MRKESMSNKQEKWGNEGKETSESLGKKISGLLMNILCQNQLKFHRQISKP